MKKFKVEMADQKDDFKKVLDQVRSDAKKT